MSCICAQKTSPAPQQHPELEEDGSPLELLKQKGYFVVRQLLSPAEVEASKEEISAVVSRWYEQWRRTGQEGNDWDEIANRTPEWKEGLLDPGENYELGFRRLFGMAKRNEYFSKLTRHDKILSMISAVLGPDIKLVQSMALLKPPGSKQKKWHQDNAYFRLTPSKIAGVWIALDPTDCDNGCMHMLPSSHHDGLFKHSAPKGHHIDYSMEKLPNPNDVVAVHMQPGDALVFHCHVAHYTPPNTTSLRRRSLQFHYASSECRQVKCPRDPEQAGTRVERTVVDQPAPQQHYFDCDPACQEMQYFYFTKGEMLVAGRDFGEGYI